jgi:hypothetical protein
MQWRQKNFRIFVGVFLGSEQLCSYFSVPCTHHYQIAAIFYLVLLILKLNSTFIISTRPLLLTKNKEISIFDKSFK